MGIESWRVIIYRILGSYKWNHSEEKRREQKLKKTKQNLFYSTVEYLPCLIIIDESSIFFMIFKYTMFLYILLIYWIVKYVMKNKHMWLITTPTWLHISSAQEINIRLYPWKMTTYDWKLQYIHKNSFLVSEFRKNTLVNITLLWLTRNLEN